MTINDIRTLYFSFMQKHGHAVVPSSSLVPEGDATTLFTSAGMQPMMPFLLGQKHPLGSRVCDSQKCFRSQDIDEVGDNRHTTFFEMLGNWSFGDYFKEDQLKMFFEFLTSSESGLGLSPSRLYVTVFEGEGDVPKDTESIEIWQNIFASVGIQAKENERIFAYPSSKNWWSRAGAPKNMPAGEPGGPDSEVFYDFGPELKLHENSPQKDDPCHPNCDCGRFMEIGNSVFMQFQKQPDGSLSPLPSKNIDFGGGLTRMEAAVNNDPDMFRISSLYPLIQRLEALSQKTYQDDTIKASMRIVADHLTASVFLIKDGVLPSNKSQGYVLRRLLRRSAVKMLELTEDKNKIILLSDLIKDIVDLYSPHYFEKNDTVTIKAVIEDEIKKFSLSLDKGLKELEKHPDLDGKGAFDLYQNYGFPLEITAEILSQKGRSINKDEFQKEFDKHRDLSRTSSAGMFKGGLADHSAVVTQYHTATHLLHAALRQVFGDTVSQKGSNITADRLRFDFSHSSPLSAEEISQIENIINSQIESGLEVTREEMAKDKALSSGALGFFGQKYPDVVSVYTIGDTHKPHSKEICVGPHVTNTKELGKIKVVKQESLGAQTRRLYLQFV